MFAGSAKRGKASTGWFLGHKLHVVINHLGEIVSFCITPGNTDDRKPVEQLTQGMWGKLSADMGYISRSLKEKLKAKGVEFITRLRSNMKRQALAQFEQLMPRKRPLIESVNGLPQELPSRYSIPATEAGIIGW